MLETGKGGERAEPAPAPHDERVHVVSCLHHFFEAEVARRPAAPAIVSGDVTLSYADVEGRANQLARFLRAGGVETGDRVGLLCERSPDAIVAILAVLKAGAAYVLLDPTYPAERLRHIVEEAGIATLLGESSLRAAVPSAVARVAELDDPLAPWRGCPTARLRDDETGLVPADLSYVIYTSGSTGRPKGVMTEHRNVVSFVAAFNRLTRLRADDRVFQGFALTFDGSVEEMWMAFSNGAALVVPPRGAPRFGDELGRSITNGGATVFSTVPTSLSMISVPLPTVRLLIVSGERCPEEAVSRWATPERRMLNVYGPTETTVNATAAECLHGRPVTIGAPLPGYALHILDGAGRPVAAGEKGELYIAGPGVARGYLAQPELTGAAFVDLPGPRPGTSVRAYRTGDLVWQAADAGDLHFHGRIDDQVKVRGFRIELPEIEAVLTEHPTIRAAVVTVAARDGQSELVAHVVAADPALGVDRNAVLSLLGARLPPYMVPAFLDVVDALPTLPSGKVDRKRLPSAVSPLVRVGRPLRAPANDRQSELLRVTSQVFGNDAISIDDDFFLALGGYSLLAARLVSELRRALGLDVAIRDIYDHPTIEALARHLASKEAHRTGARAKLPAVAATLRTSSREVFHSLSRATRAGCMTLQAAALYVVYGVASLPVLGGLLPFFTGRAGRSMPARVGLAMLLSAGAWPVLLLVSIAMKWLVIGRYKPGAYPVWGWYYLRCWLVRRFQLIALPGVVTGTPLLSLYYRLMGAKVGRDCTIDTAQCAMFDLVTIGDETSIGSETQLLGYRVEGGHFLIGSVEIGDRCFVGTHAALGLDVRMEDDTRLGDLSLLPDGATIARGEARRGSPARRGEVPVPEAAAPGTMAPRRAVLFGFLHAAVLFAVAAALAVAAIPSVLLSSLVGASGSVLARLAMLPVAGISGIVVFCLWVAVLRKVILPHGRPGIHPVSSAFYLRKWAVDLLMKVSRIIARPVYTTIYLPAWLRLLGAKIGRRAEISTVAEISPELTDLGDQSFFADGSMVGGRRIHRGLLQLAESRVGRRSFVGNSAILPVGNSLGDGCLLGCLSAPPAGVARTADGTEWLGSPSFSLPHRRRAEGFDESVTHEPTRKLLAQRFAVDALRIALPPTIAAFQIAAFAWLVARAYHQLPLAAWLLVVPAAAMATAATGLVATVLTKNLLIGTFRPTVKPLWSMFVWLNEVVNGVFETVAAPLLSPLLGTPFCAPWLRLLGCRIGRHVYLETTLFSEFDLVHVGDFAALNAGAIIQNHLFEDRIMKASDLRVGEDCAVGNMAVVLYDTEMQPGSSIGPLSLLMKGETLPPRTQWLGIPTAPLAPDEAEPVSLAAARDEAARVARVKRELAGKAGSQLAID